jgi:Sulfotransferase domain
MKAIGAGFGRMGTMSIKAALEQLGYGPCLHMIDVIRNPELRHPFVDAIESRDVDWKEAFEGWESTIDWPACRFWRQHHETWPDLPVILNIRDKEAWYKSCMKSLYEGKEMAMRGELQPPDPDNLPNPEVMKMINGVIWGATFEGRFADDKAFAFQKFDEHYAAVRSAIPKNQLLEFDATKDGWEPLCSFLGEDVPSEAFPHLNDTKSFRAQFGLPALDNA